MNRTRWMPGTRATSCSSWAKETGGTYKELEMQSEAQREQALRSLAEDGANPIIMTGFAFGDVLNTVAPDFPDTKFGIVDMVVDQPNVKSVVFTEDQGSYLVGMMAAMASKTGTVGFIGGMDIPLIRKFGCGYAQGVKAVNPDAVIVLNMTGTTPAAWNDPVKGAELAKAQIAQKADVIYAAAGGTGRDTFPPVEQAVPTTIRVTPIRPHTPLKGDQRGAGEARHCSVMAARTLRRATDPCR